MFCFFVLKKKKIFKLFSQVLVLMFKKNLSLLTCHWSGWQEIVAQVTGSSHVSQTVYVRMESISSKRALESKWDREEESWRPQQWCHHPFTAPLSHVPQLGCQASCRQVRPYLVQSLHRKTSSTGRRRSSRGRKYDPATSAPITAIAANIQTHRQRC